MGLELKVEALGSGSVFCAQRLSQTLRVHNFEDSRSRREALMVNLGIGFWVC